jgi:hypothetical protein
MGLHASIPESGEAVVKPMGGWGDRFAFWIADLNGHAIEIEREKNA